eukprot:COSAG02_NODE_10050_length_2038_cov_2.056215_2_plen_77_part_00
MAAGARHASAREARAAIDGRAAQELTLLTKWSDSLMWLLAAATIVGGALAQSSPSAAVFNYTGVAQNYTVPPGVTR